MTYLLDYRCSDPETSGIWGPFDARSHANNFGAALDVPGATWTTVELKNPDDYTFPWKR